MRPVPLCAGVTRRWQLLLRSGLLLVAVASGVRPLFAQDHVEIARRVLSRTPLIDGHNDLPWEIRERVPAPVDVRAYDLRARTPGHTDIERLRRGMVGGQYWSVYVSCNAVREGAARIQLEQIAIARGIVSAYPDVFEMALNALDVERIFGRGRIASMLGIEGAHTLEGSLGALRAFHDLGVRYVTLTHNCTNEFADAALDTARHGGLSPRGVELVGEMNRLGVLVDLSHTSLATMHDALDASPAPVIWSHAASRGLIDHARNVPDDVLRRLPANGGVVMVTFVPAFVSAAETATLADVADHVEHIRSVAGIDHVGLGGDFDGITQVVEGLEDVSTYPALLAELSRRGWGEVELAKLSGGNILRVMREAEVVARRLRRGRTTLGASASATDRGLDGAR